MSYKSVLLCSCVLVFDVCFATFDHDEPMSDLETFVSNDKKTKEELMEQFFKDMHKPSSLDLQPLGNKGKIDPRLQECLARFTWDVDVNMYDTNYELTGLCDAFKEKRKKLKLGKRRKLENREEYDLYKVTRGCDDEALADCDDGI